MSSTCKAKRGDLVALVITSTYARTSGPVQSSTRVLVHMVTSITREGAVKATRPLHGSDLGRGEQYGPEKPSPIDRVLGLRQRYVIGADQVHIPSAIAAVLAHHYPGHPGQLQPFDSLEELRELLAPFRVRKMAEV